VPGFHLQAHQQGLNGLGMTLCVLICSIACLVLAALLTRPDFSLVALGHRVLGYMPFLQPLLVYIWWKRKFGLLLVSASDHI